MDAWTVKIRSEFWLTQGKKWSHWKNTVQQKGQRESRKSELANKHKAKKTLEVSGQEIWKTVCSFFTLSPTLEWRDLLQPNFCWYVTLLKFIIPGKRHVSGKGYKGTCEHSGFSGYWRRNMKKAILHGAFQTFAVCWYSSFLFKIKMVKWELAFIDNAIITIILMENHVFKNFLFPYYQNVLSHLFILIVIHRV